MKPSFPLLAAVAIVAAAVSASSRLLAAPVSSSARHDAALLRLPPATRAGETLLYGHVKSLTRKGRRFELRFDPAWWLTGLTAQRAKLEDTGSSDVPNDYYIVEEGHRLLTYLVSPAARVTILTRGTPVTAISVSELAQIVKGKNPRHRPLFEPKAGFWIRVSIDTVRSLDQQYQP
jgi:hypothetical protein